MNKRFTLDSKQGISHLRADGCPMREVHYRSAVCYAPQIRIRHFVSLLLCLTMWTQADDGYRLWLRYDSLPAESTALYRQHIKALLIPGTSRSQEVIRKEMHAGLSGLLNMQVPDIKAVDRDGIVIIGTPASVPFLSAPRFLMELDEAGPEGFIIQSTTIDGYEVTIIASRTDTGALYGAFEFLRIMQTLEPVWPLRVLDKPRLALRLLNHWDNLDGSIERGYAGRSLWRWDELPDTLDPRLIDYARANASIGINGTVLNNVNADAASLSPEYLRKTAAIADLFRPYGIRIYLSARFSAPMELGGLDTADPLDSGVRTWWKAKADEIYRLIPDFGGFLVKANSEGQPGPLSYGRTHADGANMLAEAVVDHGGTVMWRAFVYDPRPGSDRIAQAYEAMKPFDGQFASNVLLQVKNGPLDFQPREPFSPLFGGMPQTQLMPELQVTQEYLGQSTHLVYLAPMWREFFDSDTYASGEGSTVARIVDGSIPGKKLTGVAGVANTGSDRNWTGHPLAQANWYAFGRLAWKPECSSEQIAREWIAMSLTHDAAAASTILRLLLESREAAVNYMTPLGLAHIMWEGHHYGPQPWADHLARPDWNPVYYHRSDLEGIGFDRTASGSRAVTQYNPGVQEIFADPKRCPDRYLLWFHHVPWDYPMRSGRTLWEELGLRYQSGVEWVTAARREWASVAGAVDPDLHEAVAAKLAVQEKDAVWWRDACLLYFQTFSGRELPDAVERPSLPLDRYRKQPRPAS